MFQKKLGSTDLYYYLLDRDVKSAAYKARLPSLLLNLIISYSLMQDKKIYHRDIKLENITIDLETGAIYFIDFGFATKKKKDIILFGTTDYFAPEVILETQRTLPPERNSLAADLFALAVTMLKLIKNHEPSFGLKNKLTGITDTSQYYIRYCLNNPKYVIEDTTFRTIVCGLLSRDPDKRVRFWNEKIPELRKELHKKIVTGPPRKI